MMLRATKKLIIDKINSWRLPRHAKNQAAADRRGLPPDDPGIDTAIHHAVQWLCSAQDHSATEDGGVARHYSLISGWGPSYPETTGYIVPTLLKCAKIKQDDSLIERAKRMLDWLVEIQLSDGGFQGGTIGAEPVFPVTFNTGQILLGLAAGARRFGNDYRQPMCRAADWLVTNQDADGAWRRNPTPFAKEGDKVYETHVAWGLFEAARIEPQSSYVDAAMANIRWALKYQKDNGWFSCCCLSDPYNPLTHTIGYALRGLIEEYRFTKQDSMLHAACKTADGLLNAIDLANGFIPGRLNEHWHGDVSWACLTGSAQIAHCWLMLYEFTGKIEYRNAGFAANRFVRRTLNTDGPEGIRGGIKGSFPIDGAYGAYQFLNWANKFFIDSNLLEKKVRIVNPDQP